MCGFFGVYDSSQQVLNHRHEIEKAGEVLLHRGPDDSGSYFDSQLGLTFKRLSIIDTSLAGHQPMVSRDERFVLVFNGEIYNYKELRNEMRGGEFSSESDSEVLLRAFEIYGVDCLTRLRGMFAFAVWDRKEKELTLARDRLGIKPLYLIQVENTFVFASEIKAILRYFSSHPSRGEILAFDEKSLFRYLSRNWVDDTTSSFFKNIKTVPAATFLTVKDQVTSKKYWVLPADENPFIETHLVEVFQQTVDLHLRSDVPLAFTLSGGLDSSSIIAVANKILGDPKQLNAFSILPPKTTDESSWINMVVQSTGIQHEYLQLDFEKQEFDSILDRVIIAQDEPFQSSSAVYQYLLRETVAQRGIKVLLVGEGGDEVLGGYRRLFFPYLYSLERFNREEEFKEAVLGCREFLGINEWDCRKSYAHFKTLLTQAGSGQENLMPYSVLSADIMQEHVPLIEMASNPSPSDSIFFDRLKQHLFVRDLPYVLRMEDRNSMAFGIESRVPFCDHVLIEKIFSFPFYEFFRGGKNKSILRRAMKGLLPEGVLQRYSKSPRPGNNSHFCYDVMKTQILDCLVSHSEFLVPNAKQEFELDCVSKNDMRSEFWFRFLVFARWKRSVQSLLGV